MSLTMSQKKAIKGALSQKDKQMLMASLKADDMGGEGFMDFIRSVGKFLNPVVKKVGGIAKDAAPFILKEIVLPLAKKELEKRISGKGLNVAGGGLKITGTGCCQKKCGRCKGRGLTLAGKGCKSCKGQGLSLAGQRTVMKQKTGTTVKRVRRKRKI